MYPNQEQNQYPIDYLNQIAPEPQKPGMSNKLFFLVIGIGALVAVVVGLMLLMGGGTSNSQKLEMLTARIQTLQTIADKSQKTIKSGALRSTNSNLSIFLTNANHDIVDPLQKNGVNPKKLDKKIVASENGAELTAKLEDARLNAVFDQTYAREMNYQLATLTSLMQDIYSSTKSKSLKEFLVNTNNNLQPIKQQFADFKETVS